MAVKTAPPANLSYSESHVQNILEVFNSATTEELRHGLRWYAQCHDDCRRLDKNVRRSAAVVAALSPLLAWGRNLEAAADVYAGRVPYAVLGRNVAKAQAIRNGASIAQTLKGNKVTNFWRCIVDPTNDTAVCVDRHAYSIWQGVFEPQTPNLDRIYDQIATDYREAAKRAGILPLQMQAVTWVVWRHRLGLKD